MNTILQLGILGVLFIILAVYYLPFMRNWTLFYPLLFGVCAMLCFITIDNKHAITILWNFIFKDLERSMIVGAYIIFLALAATTVAWQIQRNKKSSTATRKIFHILIVLVYVPGLLYQCSFLYIASVVIFAFLTVLEVARVIKLYPFAEILEQSVSSFIDEKDAGKVALTPLYLLIGCSVPMWIHNSPCDLIDSCSFEFLPLLAGILSIGVGDTFASVIGSKIGWHKWQKKSDKSVEGTLASIIGQCIFLYGLKYFEFLDLNTRLTALCGIAVISNALVEAFTDQVDNLVLPILTYAVLAFN
jgi:dolichol kinase